MPFPALSIDDDLVAVLASAPTAGLTTAELAAAYERRYGRRVSSTTVRVRLGQLVRARRVAIGTAPRSFVRPVDGREVVTWPTVYAIRTPAPAPAPVQVTGLFCTLCLPCFPFQGVSLMPAKSKAAPVSGSITPDPQPKGNFTTGSSPWAVGRCYLIRTVTVYVLGRLVAAYDQELVLEDASWVADTGRFHEALAKGTLSEVEPFASNVVVGRGAICDASEWLHDLPRTAK